MRNQAAVKILFTYNLDEKHHKAQNMTPEMWARMPQATSEHWWFWNLNWEKDGHYSQAEVRSQPVSCLGGSQPRNLSTHTSALADVRSQRRRRRSSEQGGRSWTCSRAGRLICHFWCIALFVHDASRCFIVGCGAVSNSYYELTGHIKKLQFVSQWYVLLVQNKFGRRKISLQLA